MRGPALMAGDVLPTLQLAMRPGTWRDAVVFTRATTEGRLALSSVQADHLISIRRGSTPE